MAVDDHQPAAGLGERVSRRPAWMTAVPREVRRLVRQEGLVERRQEEGAGASARRLRSVRDRTTVSRRHLDGRESPIETASAAVISKLGQPRPAQEVGDGDRTVTAKEAADQLANGVVPVAGRRRRDDVVEEGVRVDPPVAPRVRADQGAQLGQQQQVSDLLVGARQAARATR
ncbi:MAG: hypothetical protein M3487_09790 [Actinomycetota bacterium]|nr:hypothetical protein [Actinomycetota bacterium]